MREDEVRTAERDAEAGGLEERTALVQARRSAGLIAEDALMAAAFMGDPSAREIVPIGRYGIRWDWNDDLSASAWVGVLLNGIECRAAKSPEFMTRCAAACLRRTLAEIERQVESGDSHPSELMADFAIDVTRLSAALDTARSALAAADAWISCPCVDHAMLAKDACKVRQFETFSGPGFGSPAMLTAGSEFVTHGSGFVPIGFSNALWWWRAAPGIAAGLHGLAAETALTGCVSTSDKLVAACDAVRDEVCAWLLLGRDAPAEEASKRR